MTHKDIVKLAKEYGFTGGFDAQGNQMHDETFVKAVTEAVKRERQECAMECIALAYKYWGQNTEYHACADAIRARGEE